MSLTQWDDRWDDVVSGSNHVLVDPRLSLILFSFVIFDMLEDFPVTGFSYFPHNDICVFMIDLIDIPSWYGWQICHDK